MIISGGKNRVDGRLYFSGLLDDNVRVDFILEADTFVTLQAEIIRDFSGITSFLPY